MLTDALEGEGIAPSHCVNTMKSGAATGNCTPASCLASKQATITSQPHYYGEDGAAKIRLSFWHSVFPHQRTYALAFAAAGGL